MLNVFSHYVSVISDRTKDVLTYFCLIIDSGVGNGQMGCDMVGIELGLLARQASALTNTLYIYLTSWLL